MTVTVCPVVFKGTGKCWDAQCRLRHDVVHCEPCKCFILHGELAKHRRGEGHKLKCGSGEWKAEMRWPTRAILPSPYRYVPEPKPSKKLAYRSAKMEELAGSGRGPATGGGGEAQHLSVSGVDGLDFKSDVSVDVDKKKNNTSPVIIQKTADSVSLTLVGVAVTGAGSGGFSVNASIPMKIKGKKQRTVHVSFVPTAPGEWDARLVLRFLHVSLGRRVTFAITRRLHGVATSSVDKPRAPDSPGSIKDSPEVRASQRHPEPNKNILKNMQLRGTGQRRGTGRDSPKSH